MRSLLLSFAIKSFDDNVGPAELISNRGLCVMVGVDTPSRCGTSGRDDKLLLNPLCVLRGVARFLSGDEQNCRGGGKCNFI